MHGIDTDTDFYLFTTILSRFDPVEGFKVVAHIQRSCISVTVACSESGHISELFKKHLNPISS